MSVRWRARLMVIALAVAIALLAAAVNLPERGAVLRHLYIVPVAVAAFRFGLTGGALAALAVIVVDGPSVLAAVEREGVTDEATERVVTVLALLAGGAVGGRVVDTIRAQQRRYGVLLAVQRVLVGDVPLDEALTRLHATLKDHLGGPGDEGGVGLVVFDDDRLVVAGAGPPAAGSLAAEALGSGRAGFAADTGTEARPRRALAAPLVAPSGVLGVLVVERRGELPAAERAALTTLGVYLGLALENARLGWRQRRFADELEERVRAATRRLVELDRAKSRFLAVTSHELRTPLTALLGFSELLRTRLFPSDEVRRLAGVMHRETERLVRIVDDLLDLSRLERGIAPALRRAPVCVAAALDATVDLFAGARPTHRFAIECADATLAVDADPDALERILRNLVSNAAKYSPAGSTITLRAERSSYPGHVQIAVEDEGDGIPADALPRIFEPYYRVPQTAPGVRGSGLGLAVVKTLVEAHGGAVEAASAPQLGTRIAFLLPSAS
ncbi:MAG: HAMP domain-containing histidine kinase [Candidatus Rokubacteria bacterium]|nr:HAMP domain-containing histidine kinase [Candidatus Rokubacteria bacterium]